MRFAHLTADSDIDPRFLIVIGLGVVEFFAVFFFRHEVLWIIGVSLFLAVRVSTRLDIVGVNWLCAEAAGYSLVYRVEAKKGELADTQPVKSGEIRAGNIVCKVKEHENIKAAMAAPAVQVPTPNLGQRYRPVLITKTESGLVKLGILGHENPVPAEPDKRPYVRYVSNGLLRDDLVKLRGSHPRSAEVAKALRDLLKRLSSHDEQQENAVVTHLVSECGNSGWSVRNAMLLAGAARLIAWRRTTSTSMKAAFLAVQLFMPQSFSGTGGHATCLIKLTKLGELWRDSGPTTPEADSDINRYGRRTVLVNNHYTGDHNEVHGSANSVGRNNDVSGTVIDQRGHAADGVDTQVLAGELRRLSEYLMSQPNSLTEFVAINEVVAAIEAAEHNDKAGVLAHLAKLGKLAGWVVDAGKAIGVGVAVAAIEAALKIRP